VNPADVDAKVKAQAVIRCGTKNGWLRPVIEAFIWRRWRPRP
jgi:hypothetical protein